MLNRSASLAMSTCVLKALPGKLDIKRHSPSILYLLGHVETIQLILAVTDKYCLSHSMRLYQVMMTLHFLNDVANDAESTKSKITS